MRLTKNMSATNMRKRTWNFAGPFGKCPWEEETIKVETWEIWDPLKSRIRKKAFYSYSADSWNDSIIKCWIMKIQTDTHHPELEEILKDCCCDVYAVQHRVGEEKQEKLVVGKTHAVVHPKTKAKFWCQNKMTARRPPRNAGRISTYQGQWWSIFNTHL